MCIRDRDITVPMEMLPEDIRNAFNHGDATMMIALFDNTTSSDETMTAISQMRDICNQQCFISGMSGIVTDIKNLSLQEMPVYVVIAALLSLVDVYKRQHHVFLVNRLGS